MHATLDASVVSWEAERSSSRSLRARLPGYAELNKKCCLKVIWKSRANI